jgi:hypothetical protein
MESEALARVASMEDGPATYVIEKRRRAGLPWNFLCAFGDLRSAAAWFQKPRKRTAQYRCRCLRRGEDVTAGLLTVDTREHICSVEDRSSEMCLRAIERIAQALEVEMASLLTRE